MDQTHVLSVSISDQNFFEGELFIPKIMFWAYTQVGDIPNPLNVDNLAMLSFKPLAMGWNGFQSSSWIEIAHHFFDTFIFGLRLKEPNSICSNPPKIGCSETPIS